MCEEKFTDWLEFNDLSEQDICSLITQKLSGSGYLDYSVFHQECGLNAQEAWSLCASSLLQALSGFHQIIKRIEVDVPKYTGPVTEEFNQPYTLDRGHDKFPFICSPYKHRVSDLIEMVHEFGHAVQLMASYEVSPSSTLMPPVARECCAFIGELALIEYCESNKREFAWNLKNIWNTQNEIYYASDLTDLAQAIIHPDTKYDYRWNYPVARKLATDIWDNKDVSYIHNLFRSGENAFTLLDLGEFLLKHDIKGSLPIPGDLDSGYPEISKAQRAGIAIFLDCMEQNQVSRYSFEKYVNFLYPAIENNCIFVRLNENGEPENYAIVDGAHPEEKALIISHLCSPNRRYSEFLSSLRRHYDQDKRIVFVHKDIIRVKED